MGACVSVSAAEASARAGKRVAFLGDSMTDPNNIAAEYKYWGAMRDSLGIEPLVYAVSGYHWHDMLGMAQKLK